MSGPSRTDEILARLEEVLDPEIDRSVVEMGFVQDVQETDGNVRVGFRLPTHWCAANFAFMMASDIQTAVVTLPWVNHVETRLMDHFASGRINRAIASRAGFMAAFPDEPSGDLTRLRREFLEKSFLARQEMLLELLTDHSAALAMTFSDLEYLAEQDSAASAAARRYLSVRRQVGGPCDPTAPAFSDVDGVALTMEGLRDHLRAGRRTRRAADANAEHCRLLALARQVAPATEDEAVPAGLYE